MSKIIKLTGALYNDDIYINTDQIACFYRKEKGTIVILRLYSIKKLQEIGYLVKETPETIRLMIEDY